MAKGSKSQQERIARNRQRLYAARAELAQTQQRRRVRDNVVAGVVGGLLVVGALIAQTMYFASGPGAPQPSPQPTTPITEVTVTPTPIETNLPQPTSTEVPQPSPSS